MAILTTKPLSLLLLLFLLLHLACFLIFPTNHRRHHHRRRRSKPTTTPSSPLPLLRPTATKPKPRKPFFDFIKQIFTFPSKPTSQSTTHHAPPSPVSSTRSLRHSITRPGSLTEPEFFPLRNDIYPCTVCGEIFRQPGLLEQHMGYKHPVSELFDDEPGKNIVRIIFQSGWPGIGKSPVIYRVLKIHNSAKIIARFEEYREIVKSKAARYGGVRRRDERCIADGNELLQFHCTTYLCDQGQNELCNHQYCSLCGIIGIGFSAKMDGISTFSTSWKAHMALPEDIEEEFQFMHVKRAMLVCRVIAGRVGCDPDTGDKGCDSLVGRESGGTRDEEDELIVFNPRAVLPCFVIAYSV